MFWLNPSTPRQVEQLQKIDDTKVKVIVLACYLKINVEVNVRLVMCVVVDDIAYRHRNDAL
jgi:hypothetical protein